jgi:hypothetical protein
MKVDAGSQSLSGETICLLSLRSAWWMFSPVDCRYRFVSAGGWDIRLFWWGYSNFLNPLNPCWTRFLTNIALFDLALNPLMIDRRDGFLKSYRRPSTIIPLKSTLIVFENPDIARLCSHPPRWLFTWKEMFQKKLALLWMVEMRNES